MSMASSLITTIDSALINLQATTLVGYQLKIGLRNLKLLLVCLKMSDCYAHPSPGWLIRNLKRVLRCLRKLCDDDVDDDDDDDDVHLMNSSSALASLFSRIEDVVGRSRELSVLIASEVHCLAKEVANGDEWCTFTTRTMTVADVVWMAHSILDNAADFLDLVRENAILTGEFGSIFEPEVFDAFRVSISFLKSFLLLANPNSAEHITLQNVMSQHIQPIVINAASVFIMDGDDYDAWLKEVQGKCSAVNGMANDPRVYQVFARALSSLRPELSAPTLNLENFLDSLISILWGVLQLDACHLASIMGELKSLYEGLRFVRATLRQQLACSSGQKAITVLICDAGEAICSLHFTDADELELGSLLERFDSIRVRNPISANASQAPELDTADDSINISDGDANDLMSVENDSASSSHQPPTVAGFQEDEIASVLDRLTRGSKQLQIVSILGMAGVGKTTFALQVYNHPTVRLHFRARVSCTVSQVLDRKRVLLELFKQIQPWGEEMSEDDLANKLRQNLKRKRYLVFLDDVWTSEAWDSLKASFPDDSTECRVIFTSRNHNIVPSEHPHFLRLRTDKECLEILETRLSRKRGWTPELGLQFANRCKGLPLVASIVAGILATKQKEGWKAIIDNLSTGGVSIAEQCNTTLELSYQHLPDYLQPCFLYFGAFSEAEEIYVKRLIRLWMAEEFVIKRELKRIEDVAQEYMEELIERSLVVVVKNRSTGGAKTCRIHDLLHEFCLEKVKKENFFHHLGAKPDELSNYTEPCSLQRLCIHSDQIVFKNSMLFCPRAHSLVFCNQQQYENYRWFDMSYIIQVYKLIKVLDLFKIYLTAEIPSEIEMLSRLRFLSTRSSVAVIPSSIGNLSNLETLVAVFDRSYKDISFPDTLWNLVNLKYLLVKCHGDYGFTLPVENLDNSSDLLELETIHGVVFYSDDGRMEKQLRKLPNIRKLNCSIRRISENEFVKIKVPDFLNQLESLTISGKGKLKCKLGSENLRKVTLKRFEVSREEIAGLGRLGNLKVLKLVDLLFLGGTLEMEDGEFPELEFLHVIDKCGAFHRWIIVDEQLELPSLKKLVLSFCVNLEEIPCSCLETSPTFEEIQINYCSVAMTFSALGIWGAHQDLGNFINMWRLCILI